MVIGLRFEEDRYGAVAAGKGDGEMIEVDSSVLVRERKGEAAEGEERVFLGANFWGRNEGDVFLKWAG